MDGVEVSAEVGCEHLEGGCRQPGAQCLEDRAKVGGAAVGQVVAIDAGDDDVAQAHVEGRLGDARGLVRIERCGPRGPDRAEPASPRAIAAHHHEGRRALRKTLAEVRAAGLFTHRIQAARTQTPFEAGDGLALADRPQQEVRLTKRFTVTTESIILWVAGQDRQRFAAWGVRHGDLELARARTCAQPA